MKSIEERKARILQKAQEKERERQIKRKRTVSALLASSIAIAVILALNLVLFLPYTVGGANLSAYKKSEYYPLLEKIDELTSHKYTTNNFHEWGLDSIADKNDGSVVYEPSNGADMSPAPGNSSEYQEVTNNQVSGVIEGDIFKRSRDHIWYLSYTSSDWENSGKSQCRLFLSAYSIAGYDSKLVNTFPIIPEEDSDFYVLDSKHLEMFLSDDAKTVTIFVPCHISQKRPTYTAIISVDVSDPAAPQEVSRRYVSGSAASVRKTDGKFLLASEMFIARPNFSKPEECLPQTGEIDTMQSLSMGKIVLPERAKQANYTVFSVFDEKNLETLDSVAFFSCSSTDFVSRSHMFASYTYTDEIKNEKNFAYTVEFTQLYCISYQDGLEVTSSFCVEGTAQNQYSFDEKDGVLRVFTTSFRRPRPIHLGNTGSFDREPDERSPQCNLFCFDINEQKLIASVLNFAPKGETIQSARFDGDKAYVCTAEVITLTDPVYEFDLSDYSNITQKNTGDIPGYSMNLAKFYGDTLIGIGYGKARNDLKIEVYEASGNAVVSVAALEMKNIVFSADFKDYFLDRERGLIGLAITNDSYLYESAFVLLQLRGNELVKIFQANGYSHLSHARACIADGFLYLLDGDCFTVKALDELVLPQAPSTELPE